MADVRDGMTYFELLLQTGAASRRRRIWPRLSDFARFQPLQNRLEKACVVGGGVKSDSEVSWILSFILGDPEGAEIAHRIDATIARLPGLAWFDRLNRSRKRALCSGGALGTVEVPCECFGMSA